MSLTYFGFNSDENVDSAPGNLTLRNNTLVWTCPGSGAQNVGELSIRCRVNSGSGSIRLAIFNTDTSFVMQGSAAVSVTGTSLSWIGHTAFVNQVGSPIATPQLTGGTNYILAASIDNIVNHAYQSGHTNGDCIYLAEQYQTGFPVNIPGGTGSVNWYCIRCGVEPAVAPPTPLAGYVIMGLS
jgi:hypothetical protein